MSSTNSYNIPHILVTGGAGYIGSHTVLELLKKGLKLVVVDSLVNSSIESLERVTKLTGYPVPFHRVDICDRPALESVFRQYKISSVIHFAGLKAVGESVRIPLYYYQNNITGTLVLLEVMKAHGVKDIVFSSSATVYGEPERLPLTEDCRIGSTNPYGRTKQFIESIMQDLAHSDPTWNVILLRYFNPVGAHESGLIGEDPKGTPNNLMPFVSQVAVGKRPQVNVFGNDYDTKDGTGVRDYIHVVDLALGHVAAVAKLMKRPGCVAYNLGTGVGYSVLEMIEAMSKSSGRSIAYEIVGRRPGDVGEVYADVSKAQLELKWKATRGLQAMCDDLWRWQAMNPQGFEISSKASNKTAVPLLAKKQISVDVVPKPATILATASYTDEDELVADN